MVRKFYTIDDLYNFCKENKYESFSSEKQGAPLIVQSMGVFELADNLADGLMPVKLKSCHTGKNRNRSGISDDTMNLYKDSFKGRPILGAIYKTDTGEYEFRAHDMEIVENEDGTDINYIEQPIGFISETETPYLEYDEDADKNYLMVSGKIFADYSKAAEILERRRTCKCSVEIAVEEMSYNCAEDYLSIDKFRFCGVTILGYQQDGVTEIQEGMAGSKITIDDFSEKRNSMFSEDCQNKLIETLEKLNITLSSFHKTSNSEEGGDEEMDNVEQVVTDEVVETAAAEEVVVDEQVSDEVTEDVVVVEEETVVEETVVEETSTSENGDDEEQTGEEHEEVVEKCELKYELSHDDIRTALYALLAATTEDGYYTAWIVEVYDDKFIYHDWDEGKYYRQKYTKDDENVALDGEPIEVFSEWLTKDERDALDALKADYAALKSFKDNYDAAELDAQKEQVFAKKSYEKLADVEAFKELKKNKANFSVDEIVEKAKIIYADFMEQNEVPEVETQPTKVMGFNFNKKEAKKSPYGNLFNKD